MPPTLLQRVERRGLVTEQEIVEWVLGERPRGTWWSHPRAKQAYDALVRLTDETSLLSLKLVDGKQTLVHRRLWPALVRLQREPSLWPPLSPGARALLGEVRARRELRTKGKPRLELERALRVVATHVHTERGHHEVVLVPFEDWVPDEVAAEAATLSLEEATGQLRAAGYEPTPKRGRTARPVTRSKAAVPKGTDARLAKGRPSTSAKTAAPKANPRTHRPRR